MISALGTAASGMEAQMEQINHITNNLANVNTNGFKRSRAEFQDLLYETLQEPGANTSALTQAPVGIQRGMGVKISGTQRNFETGHALQTQRDLDMMIKGDGFFVVQLPNGDTAFRRDGSFQKSAVGRLETIDGYPLQPEVTVPPGIRKIEINEKGMIDGINDQMEKVRLGQVELATFVNNGGLKAVGANNFVATPASGPANITAPAEGTTGGLLQYYLESSNVDMVKEMTEMISAQRAFEMNSKVMQTVDQVLQHTVGLR